MDLWIWIVLAAALLGAAFLLILRWCYRQAFDSDRRKSTQSHDFLGDAADEFCRAPMYALVDELEACPFERVTITSHDGLRLSACYYHFSDSNQLEILFHGWRSNAVRDGCGGAKLARDLGYNLLLVDQRSHGESEGRTITFGVKEQHDCLDWIAYAIGRFGKDVKILLGGVSMGAATVLMASGLDLPENVVGITADCGYSSPEAIIRKVCRDRGIPDRIGYPFVRMGARLFGGFSLSGGGCVDAVRRARVPIMIMHGEGDTFVPFSMCREIYDACASEKRLLTVPKANHGLSYFYETERYTREVGDFKRACLDGTSIPRD